MKTTRILSCFFMLIAAQILSAKAHTLSSPDGNLQLKVATGSEMTIEVKLKGQVVLEKSKIQMLLEDGRVLGVGKPSSVSAVETVDEIIEPVVPQKSSRIRDHYNAFSLAFGDDYEIQFRAFNDGVAYRYVTRMAGDIIVRDEVIDMQFPEGTSSFFPEEESQISHNERLYPKIDLLEIDESRFCSLPVMINVPDAGRVLFTEADLYDYPNIYMKGGEGTVLHTDIPRFVLEFEPKPGGHSDRNVIITKEAPYIAETKGTRDFPWRVFIISDRDGTFIESDLVFQLSRPLELEDTSWIEPGKVAWDWYNANNIFGVDFPAGENTDTYKYYIDFASDAGIEYVILDEGWSISTTDISQPNPNLSVTELVDYGKKRGVRIILWGLWKPFVEDAEAEKLFDLYQSWGVAGVKIDFMQRNDQWMVQFYEKTVRAAAKRELLVDYHGAFKPGGMRRAFPNLITYEGVKGAENNKWSADITPTHNVTIPFTRMAAGPMDYTPGGVVNAQPKSYRQIFYRPMTMGTRAHEVAKYVVFESALQMLCESPSMYRKEMETVEYITSIPTTWDETHVIDAKVAEYILLARRKGDTWYIAAMTNEEARELEFDLSFLGKGKYRAHIFQDGINAHRNALDYKTTRDTLSKDDTLKVNLAPSGGWTAVLQKK
jgi:alpha-glucosidase